MTSPIRTLIGQRIKAFRKKHRATQAVLAEAIGCEVTTLGRYERGEYAPDGEQLVKIAAFFQITPMDLLPGEVDIERQSIIDLRAGLVESIYSIDDPIELGKLLEKAKETINRAKKTR
jgi:transcriptional regulator with XRE-family HTH domain